MSVIIPVRNAEAYLLACLDALFKQDYTNFEIIVVDDGSADRSRELVRPPARLLSSGGRRGAGAARNTGAKAAQGEVLFFTDADVIVPSDWIRRSLTAMRETGVRCGGGGYAGPAKPIFIEQFAFEELAWRRRHWKGYVRTLVSNNMFCEKKLFFEAGGFPETYNAASSEDMEFSWRLSMRHRLWWDEKNGVYHHFPDTVFRYLRQQFRFARDAVPMLLLNPRLASGRTHHGKQLYAEVGLTALFLVAAPIMGAWSFLALLGEYALNMPFLARGSRKYGLLFALKAAGLLFARNVVILCGIAAGVLHLPAHARSRLRSES